MLAQAYSPALDPGPLPGPSPGFTASSSPPSPSSPASERDTAMSSDGASTSSTSLEHAPVPKPAPSSTSPPPPRRASHLGGSLPSSAPPVPAAAPSGLPHPSPPGQVNPLFALGEQVRAGTLDPALVRFQQNGAVVVREGPTPRMASRAQTPPRERDKGDGGGPRWGEWVRDRVRPKRHHHDGGVGADGGHEGRTLQLEEQEEGDAKQVEDFRDRPDTQDHVDEARIKLREWRSDFQDRLEDSGLRPPSPWRRGENGSSSSPGREECDPRVASALERPPEELHSGEERPGLRHVPSSTLDGASSFYSAASDTDGPPSFVPARSESPISYASTAEHPAASTSTASPVPSTSADSLDRSPVVCAPGFVATNSRLVPLPDQPQHSQRLSSRASHASIASSASSRPPNRSAIPAHEVAPPSPSHPDVHQLHPPPPASPRARHRQTLAAPPSPRSSGGTYLHPPSPSTSANRTPSPPVRRSSALDSPTLLSTPSLALGPAPPSRRFSSASSSTRLSPSPAQRSHSFTLPPALPSPTQPLPPVSPGSTVVLDDVDASIAAQAEAIRRQRQEKRAEAEKEQAKLAAARALAPPPQGSSSAVGGGAQPGPGGLKRRTTRMGSGGSAVAAAERDDSQPSSAAVEGAGEDGAATANAHPGVGTRQKSRLAGTEGDYDPGAGVLVGNLIGQDHANYVLMYNMLTGIRIGVSRCQAKAARPLTDADYTARHKFSFDIVGNELTPSVKYDFKFKDYAPWVFRELREYFYLDPSDYLMSLTSKYILSELGSPGKSGSFFYFSRDYRFIIKTIRHAEHKFLRSILKEYHEHVKRNPHTLLSRFYGLHRVKLPHGRKIHFVIMNNLFPPHRDIHETYDLKGSAIGRLYPEERAANNPHAVLKDLNWVQRRRQLALGPEKKALFEEQLRRDTELLQRLRIMDYSLLTGIHNGVRGNSEGLREDKLSVFQPATVKVSRKPTQIKRDADASALRKAVQQSDPQALGGRHGLPEHDNSERRMFLFYQDEGGMRATGDGNEDLGVIYYLGIIDILTPYTCVKRIEHFFKGMKHNKHMISAVPPREYGDRFLAFIKSSIRGNDESIRPQMYEHEPKPAAPPAAEKGKEKPPLGAAAEDEKAQTRQQEMQEAPGAAPVVGKAQ
ncbi:Phosphatidylinositol-4-phosphate 5-kinase [Rhodotorula kratochvilovae]